MDLSYQGALRLEWAIHLLCRSRPAAMTRKMFKCCQVARACSKSFSAVASLGTQYTAIQRPFGSFGLLACHIAKSQTLTSNSRMRHDETFDISKSSIWSSFLATHPQQMELKELPPQLMFGKFVSRYWMTSAASALGYGTSLSAWHHGDNFLGLLLRGLY